MVPGRKFSSTMSAVSTSRRATARPSSILRLMPTERLLRERMVHQREWPSCLSRPQSRMGSPPGASTLVTSAPKSPIRVPTYGPASSCPNSMRRRPASGPRRPSGESSASAIRGGSPVRVGARCQRTVLWTLEPERAAVCISYASYLSGQRTRRPRRAQHPWSNERLPRSGSRSRRPPRPARPASASAAPV